MAHELFDIQTARTLNALNTEFYATQATSFSATRQTAWEGWARLADCLRGHKSVHITDIGCGNLRFERFLTEALPDSTIEIAAVDNCPQLAHSMEHVSFQQLDVMEAVYAGHDLAALVQAPPADIVLCSGFMHHVYSQAARAALLQALCQLAAPGGLVAVTFWRFMEHEKLATKARADHKAALVALQNRGIVLHADALDANDYLIGWQLAPGVFRYCHSFSETEIEELARAVAPQASIKCAFDADGRTHALNRYLVLQRHL